MVSKLVNVPSYIWHYIHFLEIISNKVGKDLFDDPNMLQIYEELTGIRKVKPFECGNY